MLSVFDHMNIIIIASPNGCVALAKLRLHLIIHELPRLKITLYPKGCLLNDYSLPPLFITHLTSHKLVCD